jgi:hypothetical protein
MKRLSLSVPIGYALNFEFDSITTGTYVQTGGQNTPTALAASTAYTVGPFNDTRNYIIEYDGNDFAYTIVASGVYSGADEVDLGLKAPKASPTFTGTVVLPSTTSIGDVSSLELGYLNNVSSALQTQIDAKAPTVVTANVGAVNSGTTAAEYGDGYQHTTVLTVNSTLPAIAGGAALSVGKLLYTFPAGAIIVKSAYMSMGITQTEANINADTPDVGLGTVIAAGANALLSDTAGAENVLTGQTANDCTGTAEVKTVADQVLVIEAAGDHTVYFNVADTWAASGDAAAIIAGTVVLNWQFMA